MLSISKWIEKYFILRGAMILSLSLLSFNFVTHATELPVLHGVGGDFSAVSSDGTPFHLSDLNGKVVIMGFGYTNCADVCPLTLSYLKTFYESLSKAEQEDVQVLFVTVDPDYDTPQHLNGFLNHFHPDFVGLTGTRQQVDDIIALYKASYNPLSSFSVDTSKIRNVHQKEMIGNREDKGKLYNHSIALYLHDKEGSVRSLAYTGTPLKKLIKITQYLLSDATSLPLSLNAQKKTESGISAKHFRLTLPASVSKVAAAYGELKNMSEESDILLSASSEVADKVEIHLSMISEGTVSMYPLEHVVLPAKGAITFKPGDLHLMVMGLKRRLKPDQKIPIVLHFSKTGDVTVSATVNGQSGVGHHLH